MNKKLLFAITAVVFAAAVIVCVFVFKPGAKSGGETSTRTAETITYSATTEIGTEEQTTERETYSETETETASKKTETTTKAQISEKIETTAKKKEETTAGNRNTTEENSPYIFKLKNVYYYRATDFGAKPGDDKDDTEAIQNCIDKAHSDNVNVYLPAGTYLLSTNLYNKDNPSVAHSLRIYSNEKIVGDDGAKLMTGSPDVTHIIFTSNDDGATGYNGARNIEISNIIFDGNKNLTDNKITAVNISHADNIGVDNCTFINGNIWHNIEINSSRNVTVNSCTFYENKKAIPTAENIQLDGAFGKGNLGKNDGTVCDNIIIQDSVFRTKGNPAIGNHFACGNKNIVIRRNRILSPDKIGGYNGAKIDFTDSGGSADNALFKTDESLAAGAENVKVEFNYIECEGSGLAVRIFNNKPGSARSTVVNNIFMNCSEISKSPSVDVFGAS